MPTALAALLLLLPALAPAALTQDADPGRARTELAVSSHFTVSFQGPEEGALAARVLESLDRAYWRVGDALNTFPATPVPVVLYTAEEFRDVTRAPQWAAGAYDGTIRIPIRGALAHPDELDRVLAHEFTHALIRSLAPRPLPTWLNEGVAAALERDTIDWAVERVRAAGEPASLNALNGSFARFTAPQAELAYATSAVAVRRLLDANGGVAVANLIRDIGHGEPLAAAFEHRINTTLADFAAGLRSTQ